MKKKSKCLVILAWSVLIALICNGQAVAVEYTSEELCRMALERSEKIKIMEDNVSIARTGKDKKMSALLPKLTAYGSYTDWTETKYSPATVFTPTIVVPGTVIQPNSGTAWGVRLDQSITLNGKEITDFSISKDNIERQQNETNAQKEEYLMMVSAAYYEMLRAQKVLEIANATVERLTAYRKAAENRLKVGEVTKTVLLRADGELSGALSDQIKAKNALDLSRAVLARIVGISEDFTLKENFLEDAPLPPLDSYVNTGLAQRAEMKAVEIEKQMAKDQIRVAKGGYWPILSISGAYGGMDQDPVPSTINRESAYGQVALNYPFFEGGLRRAEVKEAMIRDRQAGLRMEDLKKTIRIEVETTYLELKNQRGIIKSLEDQLLFSQENYKAVTRQFEMGLANSIDVMDANTLLVSTERQLTTAVYSHQVFKFRMKRATGVLLTEFAGNAQAAKAP
ncbi:MAG: TolC family protein [Syntrophales bacterium]|nr:TolC family protein [Syntrophales bacterium]MCK9390057.1 TolC family protein [Syntrophales bacterium]